MESTPIFDLTYDPATCDWNETIDNFYLENPGLLGRVMLLLKPCSVTKRCSVTRSKDTGLCNKKSSQTQYCFDFAE